MITQDDVVSGVLDDIDPEIKELVRRRGEDQGNGLAGVIPPKKLPGMEARAAQGKTRPKRRHGREKGRKL